MIYCNNDVIPSFSKYENGRIKLELLQEEERFVFTKVTVNLKDELTDSNCAFIDTNQCINILSFLEKNKMGILTGKTGKSSLFTYPEFRFDEKIIKKFS